MRRRAYLSLTIGVLAGCGSQGTDGATPTGTERTTTTPTSTPTETPTATPVQAPDDPLEAYEWWLAKALEAYVPQGESFGSITAADTGIDLAAVRENFSEATAVRSDLESAGLSGEREARFEKLTGTFRFLDRTVQVHEHLTSAWAAHRKAWDAVVTQETDPSPSFQAVDAAASNARADANNLVAESNPSDVSVFPPLLVNDYENKVGQIDSEVTAFVDIVDALGNLNSAMGEAERGIIHYENGSYTPSSVAFNDAANAFGSVANTFTGGWPDHFSPTTNDASCVAGAMQSGCKRMSAVARALADGEESDPDAAKQSARSRFEQCPIVFDRVSLVEDFFA